MSSQHQYVVITGGGSGLGKALAQQWFAKGASVCILDINKHQTDITCNELNHSHSHSHSHSQQHHINSAFSIECDITQPAKIALAISLIQAKWPHIDMVINNAGVATADVFETESIAQWRWIMEVNLFGTINLLQVIIPIFKLQGYGQILNVASQAALTPIPYMASYNVSKSAVVALSETLRLELADHNIQVSVLYPGFFKTNLGASLRTQLSTMSKVMQRFFDKATIDAKTVAQKAYVGVNRQQFMILTHQEGKMAYRIKRWLPLSFYLNHVLKQTSRLRAKVKQEITK